MFCTKCGNQVPDGQKFCSACGNPMAPAQQPQQPQYAQPQQPQFQQPQYNQQAQYGQPQFQQPQYGQPQYQQPVNNVLAMGWFKFLIYFALFAGALLNIVAAITSMTGAQYTAYGQNLSAMVYAMFPGLQGIDIIYGILLIALAGLQIFCRFRLAGYYKNGPKLVTLIYIANVVISLVYLIACVAIVGGLDVASVIPSLIVSIVMAVVNHVYFKKRSHLFTR